MTLTEGVPLWEMRQVIDHAGDIRSSEHDGALGGGAVPRDDEPWEATPSGSEEVGHGVRFLDKNHVQSHLLGNSRQLHRR